MLHFITHRYYVHSYEARQFAQHGQLVVFIVLSICLLGQAAEKLVRIINRSAHISFFLIHICQFVGIPHSVVAVRYCLCQICYCSPYQGYMPPKGLLSRHKCRCRHTHHHWPCRTHSYQLSTQFQLVQVCYRKRIADNIKQVYTYSQSAGTVAYVFEQCRHKPHPKHHCTPHPYVATRHRAQYSCQHRQHRPYNEGTQPPSKRPLQLHPRYGLCSQCHPHRIFQPASCQPPYYGHRTRQCHTYTPTKHRLKTLVLQ